MYKYSDIRPYLKTGDIILFSRNRYSSLACEIAYNIRAYCTGTNYGHVGLVYKCRGKLYLIEFTYPNHSGDNVSVPLSRPKCGGVRIIYLDTLLKEYKKDFLGIYGVKFIEKEIPNYMVFDAIKKYQSRISENRIYLFILYIIDTLISHKLAKSVSNIFYSDNIFCSKVLYEILYECKIVKKYNSHLIWPHTFVSKKFNKLQNVKYSPTISFNFSK